jgi:hypothetical protein
MPATSTPRPIWAGFVPPVSACAPPAPLTSCESVSWNCTADDLNAVVLTLAMLLPVTSSIVWWERRPEIPEYSERSMADAFLLGGRGQSVEGSAILVIAERRMVVSPTVTVGASPSKDTAVAVPVWATPSASG